MKIVRDVLKGIAAAPGKSLLTIFTVGAGVGVLILALSLSSFFSDLVEKQLSGGETIVTFANAELNAEGQVDSARPPQFDEQVTDIVQTEVSGVTALSPVVTRSERATGTFGHRGSHSSLATLGLRPVRMHRLPPRT